MENLILINQVLLAIVSILTFIVLRNWLGREQVTYLITPEERHTLSVDVTKASKEAFEDLAAHMGVTREEAMLEAFNDWEARNAELYDYNPSTTEEATDDTSNDA